MATTSSRCAPRQKPPVPPLPSAAGHGACAPARAGDGPRLIEAVTYRLGDHTTADDASRYRQSQEVQERWKQEPIVRLGAYLVAHLGGRKAQEEKVAPE